MSNGETTAGRQITRSASGPADPFNSLLQAAGLMSGQQAGITGIGGSRFGSGLGFNSDVFGGGGASSPIGNFPGFFSTGLTPQGAQIGGRIPGGGGNASPLGAARQNLNQTLSGDFLSPDSNPFLGQTFDRAADLTRTRLASEFAGSGRDIAASRPARSDELQTLASGIFGSNFQNERNRQVAALSQARQLDPLNEFIRRLGVLTPLAGRNNVSESTADEEFKGSPLDRVLSGIGSLFGSGGGGGGGGLFGSF